MFKARYMGTPSNPSQALVLEASCGLLTEVPLGHEVQWWHMGEDGAMPQLVRTRAFHIDGQTWDCFEDVQEWVLDEFLAEVYSDDKDGPEPRPEAALLIQPEPLPEFITLPIDKPQWAFSLPGYGRECWPFPFTPRS